MKKKCNFALLNSMAKDGLRGPARPECFNENKQDLLRTI